MSSNELNADLTSLQSDYQILTELRRSANSTTYLARHLELNRDVTITVIRATGSGDNNTLTHFASDARTLTAMRHRNVVPVIEGRWLADDVFAIVRARVRGSTLDQLVSTGASGHVPLPTVAATLEAVYAGIEWARTNGIVHRYASADSIVFQQGSGRVLLELDPEPLGPDGVPDACDDLRTIGRLAWEMLSGQRANGAPTTSLAAARPDLSPKVVEATEALMHCDRNAPGQDVAALIATIGGKGDRIARVPSSIRETGAPAALPAAQSDAAVVVVKRSFGFNARLATAVAVAAVIGALGLVMLHRRGSQSSPADSTRVIYNNQQSTGDVTIPPAADPSSAVTSADSSARSARTPPRDTSAGASGSTGDACSSPHASDQHACLLGEIERNDGTLKAVFQRLVSAMRRQANVQAGDPDPDTVEQLRSAERKWVDARDVACRGVGDPPLYARARAQCFADQSAARTRELQDMLNALVPSA